MSTPGLQRVTVGFQGGQVLALRMLATQLDGLHAALDGGGWHEVTADDATVRIDLRQVVYVRTDRDEPRVGFGS